jgi:NAD(P)-dependent dehydrogenase (short-subunit alcohol dehydrogenase family)
MTAMRRSGGGSIVNLGSICSEIGWETVRAYCASKGGVSSLTRASALGGAKFGVRVNAALPGFIWTPMTAGFYERKFGGTEAAQAELAKRHPIGRVGWPEDIPAAVLYLASDEAGFVTGTELAVDGGFLAE